jgi:coenzyme F420-dependent glucose-6-phosphate dehydrogenase
MSGPAVRLGLHLSAEEHPPDVIVATATRAEQAGFHFITVSDHFHPWTTHQGESPFVWAVLGAIAQATERVEVGTAVTCPTIRTHPAIIAHAAATVAAMMPGRFFLGVGTGERLNESVHGDRWPPATVRRDMLEEAVEIMRALWTGEMLRAHHGRHYTVERARIFTRPEEPPPIVVSGFGPQSVELAGRIGDGYMHETWPTSALQGELGQELATPEHYEQAAANVTEEEVAEGILCANDPQNHLDAIAEYADAGFDHVLVQQCGDDQERLIALYADAVLPELTAPTSRPPG